MLCPLGESLAKLGEIGYCAVFVIFRLQQGKFTPSAGHSHSCSMGEIVSRVARLAEFVQRQGIVEQPDTRRHFCPGIPVAQSPHNVDGKFRLWRAAIVPENQIAQLDNCRIVAFMLQRFPEKLLRLGAIHQPHVATIPCLRNSGCGIVEPLFLSKLQIAQRCIFRVIVDVFDDVIACVGKLRIAVAGIGGAANHLDAVIGEHIHRTSKIEHSQKIFCRLLAHHGGECKGYVD